MFLYTFSVYRDRPVPHCLYHNDDAVLLGPLDDQTTETFRVFLKVVAYLLFGRRFKFIYCQEVQF